MTIWFSLALTIVFGGLAITGWNKNLPRNAIYGLRTGATTQSDETWVAAHHAAAPANFVASLCFGCTALAAGVIAGSPRAESIAAVIGWGLGLLALAVAVFTAQRAAEKVLDD